MARAGKIVSDYHRGTGPNSGAQPLGVHRLTTLRCGPIGETGAHNAADMYVDPFPYVSLAGVNPGRLYNRRSNTARATDESHIQKRTRGKSTGSANTQADGRSRGNALTRWRDTEGHK